MNSVTDQIKEKIDIVEFISSYVQLKKAGRNFVGFCPFHSNTRTPSFTVFPETQSYHCFGCKASGTVFDFLMQREGLEFRDALEQLARRAGVALQERTPEDESQDQQRTRLLEIHTAAAAFFHHLLVRSPRGEQARAYVARRAISQETIEAFQLGYAADEWSALLSYLTDRKGFEPEEIEQAGLAIRREQGGYYDRFRGRLRFPIRSPKGEIIAFGGRAMGDAQPKYMNSPQTPLFDKSRVLYGFDLARDAIRAGESVVIVEGYVDVIMAHQHGFANVVAPLGTALTTEHVGQIKRLARRVYLALDADPAGMRAALKGVQTFQDQPEGELVAITSPYGVVGLQRSQSVEIRVIALPDGQDPDEVIQKDQALWRQLIDEARPAMDFYIEALTSDLDLASARGKASAVERLAPLLGQITNPVEHAYYIQQIARLIDIDEQSILRALPRSQDRAGQGAHPSAPRPARDQQPARGAQAADPASAAAGGPAQREEHLLGWMLRYPSARDAVQEKLRRDLASFVLVQQLVSDDLVDLFERVEHRAVWVAWRAQAEGADTDQWAAGLDDALRATARRALENRLPDPQAYRYVNDALECATILQQYQARRWLSRIKHEAHEAADSDARAQALEMIVQLQEYLGMISAPRRSSTYADLHNLHSV
jgi:DNA primase